MLSLISRRTNPRLVLSHFVARSGANGVERMAVLPFPSNTTHTQTHTQHRFYSSSSASSFAMKPGTTLDGLHIFPEEDPPVVLKREEYPEWINDLAKPLKSFKELEKVARQWQENHEKGLEDDDEAISEKDMTRYFRMVNKKKIKAQNAERRKD